MVLNSVPYGDLQFYGLHTNSKLGYVISKSFHFYFLTSKVTTYPKMGISNLDSKLSTLNTVS